MLCILRSFSRSRLDVFPLPNGSAGANNSCMLASFWIAYTIKSSFLTIIVELARARITKFLFLSPLAFVSEPSFNVFIVVYSSRKEPLVLPTVFFSLRFYELLPIELFLLSVYPLCWRRTCSTTLALLYSSWSIFTFSSLAMTAIYLGDIAKSYSIKLFGSFEL